MQNIHVTRLARAEQHGSGGLQNPESYMCKQSTMKLRSGGMEYLCGLRQISRKVLEAFQMIRPSYLGPDYSLPKLSNGSKRIWCGHSHIAHPFNLQIYRPLQTFRISYSALCTTIMTFSKLLKCLGDAFSRRNRQQRATSEPIVLRADYETPKEIKARLKRQKKENYASIRYLHLRTKSCPSCNLMLEKDGGCSHMTCK